MEYRAAVRWCKAHDARVDFDRGAVSITWYADPGHEWSSYGAKRTVMGASFLAAVARAKAREAEDETGR